MKNRIMTALVLMASMLVSMANAAEQNHVSIFYMYQNWKLTLPQVNGSISAQDQKLNQGVFGLAATGVLSARFHLDLNGTLASSTARLEFTNTANNVKQSLSALNDTRLRLTYVFGDNKGNASFFVNMPTGKKKLTVEQYLLTAQLADLSRKFMIRRYGQGLDLGGEWYALPRWGNFGLDFGGGYLYHGKFQPLDSINVKYKYGDEVFGKVGFDVYGQPWGASADVNLRYYMKDKSDDQDVFQAGFATIINAVLSYSGTLNFSAGTSIMLRGKAKILNAEQVLSDEQFKSGRNEVTLFANGGYPIAEKLRILGRLEYQSVSANGYDKNLYPSFFLPKSHYVGFGGGLGYALSENVSASSLVSYYTGNVDTVGSLKGLGLTFVLSFQPGQGR